MKRYALCLFFPFLLAGCRAKEDTRTTRTRFSYFEISYTDGWAERLSFCVDSNRIFFFPQLAQPVENNKTKYGLLPDSICQQIETAIQKLKAIASLDPDSTYCYDCPEVSVIAIDNNDTVRVFQAGKIDDHTRELIKQLQVYKKMRLDQLGTAYFFLETMQDIMPPPPPPIHGPPD